MAVTPVSLAVSWAYLELENGGLWAHGEAHVRQSWCFGRGCEGGGVSGTGGAVWRCTIALDVAQDDRQVLRRRTTRRADRAACRDRALSAVWCGVPAGRCVLKKRGQSNQQVNHVPRGHEKRPQVSLSSDEVPRGTVTSTDGGALGVCRSTFACRRHDLDGNSRLPKAPVPLGAIQTTACRRRERHCRHVMSSTRWEASDGLVLAGDMAR